jgi:hypothetical protein
LAPGSPGRAPLRSGRSSIMSTTSLSRATGRFCLADTSWSGSPGKHTGDAVSASMSPNGVESSPFRPHDDTRYRRCPYLPHSRPPRVRRYPRRPRATRPTGLEPGAPSQRAAFRPPTIRPRNRRAGLRILSARSWMLPRAHLRRR